MSSMNKSEDCYYFFYSSCSKGDSCQYRHCDAALGTEDVCDLWRNGNCTRKMCAFRHSETSAGRQRSMIACYWEAQAGGCQRSHCPYAHQQPKQAVPYPQRLRAARQKQDEIFMSMKIKDLDTIRGEKSATSQQQFYLPGSAGHASRIPSGIVAPGGQTSATSHSAVLPKAGVPQSLSTTGGGLQGISPNPFKFVAAQPSLSATTAATTTQTKGRGDSFWNKQDLIKQSTRASEVTVVRGECGSPPPSGPPRKKRQDSHIAAPGQRESLSSTSGAPSLVSTSSGADRRGLSSAAPVEAKSVIRSKVSVLRNPSKAPAAPSKVVSLKVIKLPSSSHKKPSPSAVRTEPLLKVKTLGEIMEERRQKALSNRGASELRFNRLREAEPPNGGDLAGSSSSEAAVTDKATGQSCEKQLDDSQARVVRRDVQSGSAEGTAKKSSSSAQPGEEVMRSGAKRPHQQALKKHQTASKQRDPFQRPNKHPQNRPVSKEEGPLLQVSERETSAHKLAEEETQSPSEAVSAKRRVQPAAMQDLTSSQGQESSSVLQEPTEREQHPLASRGRPLPRPTASGNRHRPQPEPDRKRAHIVPITFNDSEVSSALPSSSKRFKPDQKGTRTVAAAATVAVSRGRKGGEGKSPTLAKPTATPDSSATDDRVSTVAACATAKSDAVTGGGGTGPRMLRSPQTPGDGKRESTASSGKVSSSVHRSASRAKRVKIRKPSSEAETPNAKNPMQSLNEMLDHETDVLANSTEEELLLNAFNFDSDDDGDCLSTDGLSDTRDDDDILLDIEAIINQ